MSEAGISLTFKAHTGYDSPWVVIHGETVEDAGQKLAQVRAQGIFGHVRAASAEFAAAPVTTTEQAVANIQQAVPGSQVVQQQAPAPVQPQPQYQQPVQQAYIGPVCGTCGGPTEQKSGTGRKGPWSGHFCLNSKNLPQDQRHPVAWA